MLDRYKQTVLLPGGERKCIGMIKLPKSLNWFKKNRTAGERLKMMQHGFLVIEGQKMRKRYFDDLKD